MSADQLANLRTLAIAERDDASPKETHYAQPRSAAWWALAESLEGVGVLGLLDALTDDRVCPCGVSPNVVGWAPGCPECGRVWPEAMTTAKALAKQVARLHEGLGGVHGQIATLIPEIESMRGEIVNLAASSFTQGIELAAATAKTKRLEAERNRLAARVLEIEAPGECQSLHKLRAEVGRVEAEGDAAREAVSEFLRWQASGPTGCPPYTSAIAHPLTRLDESFAALRTVEDTLRAERDELAAEVARLRGLAESCPCGRLTEPRHGKCERCGMRVAL